MRRLGWVQKLGDNCVTAGENENCEILIKNKEERYNIIKSLKWNILSCYWNNGKSGWLTKMKDMFKDTKTLVKIIKSLAKGSFYFH